MEVSSARPMLALSPDEATRGGVVPSHLRHAAPNRSRSLPIHRHRLAISIAAVALVTADFTATSRRRLAGFLDPLPSSAVQRGRDGNHGTGSLTEGGAAGDTFSIQDRAFNESKNLWAWFTEGKVAQHVICLLEFTKVIEKSVVWDTSDGLGENLAYLIKKYCQDNGKELIVEDKKLKAVIESNLGVDCFYDEYVVGELMWGLKNVLYDFVQQERDNITRQHPLPVCQGLKDCMSTFGFNISTEAIDAPFIANAGSLHRCDVMLDKRVKELREACDKFIPDIGIIEDINLYAKVVAKILIPNMESEWDFSERFPADVALKFKPAEQDARKKFDGSWYQFICCSLADIRRLPGLKANLLKR